jgi:uncharacterized protein YdaU (DUF1376 family)
LANQLHWYKRDPKAALEGMAVLSLEERGAFITVLDLIYSHDGKIDDDDRFIAGWLRVHVRVWKRIRARLLDLGKLYLQGAQLRNERADREVEAALLRVRSAANAGLASAAKRQTDLKVLKGLPATTVQRSVQLLTSTKKDSLSFLSSAAASGTLNEVPPERKRPQDVSKADLDAILMAKRAITNAR